MEINEALSFIDNLIFVKTGKHLNDLEREVFLGSWEGKTYEEIYPLNPQYVEKDVGYKLWKKLSTVLGERVSKKNFKGAIERAQKQESHSAELPPNGNQNHSQKEVEVFTKRIFISHRAQEPDRGLATQFYETLNASGYTAFMASVGAPTRDVQKGEGQRHSSEKIGWSAPPLLSQIDTELQQCDYFLLLISPQTAVSEMAIEELRRAKELRSIQNKPAVLTIRVNCPSNTPLNHDLRSYLDGNEQFEWNSPADTPSIVQKILSLLARSVESGVVEADLTRISVGIPEESIDSSLEKPESLTPLISQEDEGPSVILHSSDAPLPVAEPELPNGQVRLASAFYVERVPYETQCYKEILQPGALIRIKAPRQMGKTSLMARILYRANEQGYRTVPLSFQHADTAVFTDLNQLLRWFCARISRKLRLPHQLDDYWTDTFGSKDNCTIYFEDCLLSASDSPLVLGLDEVDRVFQYPKIADDFFGLLRAWYEEAGYGNGDSDRWQQLRLVVVHSTEVYIPLNVNQSPFNVGLPIELPDFSPEQVQDLTQRHGLNLNATQVEQLMRLVGGHPYLVRLALYHIAQQTITLDQLLETAPTEAGLYDDHLRRHLWNLQQHPELADAFAKVVMADTPIELESVPAFKLHSMGLVQLQGNYVTPRFDLYRQYFSDRLSIKN
ncbi:AAA-like domain-containing protein [Coleofasciculus sp. FACHB-129]|uniref:AAA-like domain-containing protein n=1 Tax=Cyanophyceae TaxID=3028117 RepID=UPI0016884605|nr:AAA-like domain-containing protein [Coleofasciculus sp. FACHB-129]MBD1896069.1 AAA-like domain-containing protein [Coleofasciculus sp. FACHB-129]